MEENTIPDYEKKEEGDRIRMLMRLMEIQALMDLPEDTFLEFSDMESMGYLKMVKHILNKTITTEEIKNRYGIDNII